MVQVHSIQNSLTSDIFLCNRYDSSNLAHFVIKIKITFKTFSEISGSNSHLCTPQLPSGGQHLFVKADWFTWLRIEINMRFQYEIFSEYFERRLHSYTSEETVWVNGALCCGDEKTQIYTEFLHSAGLWVISVYRKARFDKIMSNLFTALTVYKGGLAILYDSPILSWVSCAIKK